MCGGIIFRSLQNACFFFWEVFGIQAGCFQDCLTLRTTRPEPLCCIEQSGSSSLKFAEFEGMEPFLETIEQCRRASLLELAELDEVQLQRLGHTSVRGNLSGPV